MKSIVGVDNDAVFKAIGLRGQLQAKTHALVLIGAAVALCSAFTPTMTPPSVAANHPFSCPPQWLSMSLGADPESPMPPPTPPPPDEVLLSPSPPPPKPLCPLDFALLIDESGSMKQPKPDGSMEGPNGAKAFAKELVREFQLGEDLARFAVVSFSGVAITRVSWSSDIAEIDAGIDAMSADGKTSISAGFEAVHQLFTNNGREGAFQIVLLLSDGEQSPEFQAPGKTKQETAVDAASLVKNDGATVFAWGFANVRVETLQQIASDSSKAIFALSMTELKGYINTLEAAVCDFTPRKPPSPPSPPPPAPDISPPPPPSPKLPPPPPPCLNEKMHFKCSAKCHRQFGFACVNSGTKTREQCADDLLACKSMCIKCI